MGLISMSCWNTYAADASTFVNAITTLQQTYPSITKQNVAAAIPTITSILSTYGSLLLPATQDAQSALATLANLYSATWSGYAGWKQADRDKLTTAYKDAGMQAWQGDTRWTISQQSNYFQSIIDNIASIKTFVGSLNSWSLTRVSDFGSFCSTYGFTQYNFIADIEADDSTPENKKWIVQSFFDKLMQAIRYADDPGQFRNIISTLRSTNFLRNYTSTIDGLSSFIDNCIANKSNLNFIGATFDQTITNLNQGLTLNFSNTLLTAFARDIPQALNQITTISNCKSYLDMLSAARTKNYITAAETTGFINQTKDKIVAIINAATTVNDILSTIGTVLTIAINLDPSRIGNEGIAGAITTFNTSVGAATLTALTNAASLATPSQYQALKNLTTQAAAKFTATSFTSVFTAIENNLISKLGAKNFDLIIAALDAALSATPLNQANVGTALLQAFATAVPLVTTPEAGELLAQRFATATTNKAIYFTASQQTTLTTFNTTFTTRYNQIVREKNLANPTDTDLTRLCAKLAQAVTITRPIYSKFTDDLLTTFERAATVADNNLTTALAGYKSAKVRRDLQAAKRLFDTTITALSKSTNSLKQLLNQARTKIAGINQNRANTIGMKLDKLSKMKLQ